MIKLYEGIPKNDRKTHLVYCHSDKASIAGATKLIQGGVGKVFRLEGNMAGWKDAGYPIEK